MPELAKFLKQILHTPKSALLPRPSVDFTQFNYFHENLLSFQTVIEYTVRIFSGGVNSLQVWPGLLLLLPGNDPT